MYFSQFTKLLSPDAHNHKVNLYCVHFYVSITVRLKMESNHVGNQRCVVILVITCNCIFYLGFPKLYFEKGKFWGNMQNPCDNNTKKQRIHFCYFFFYFWQICWVQLDRQSLFKNLTLRVFTWYICIHIFFKVLLFRTVLLS